MDTPYEVFNFDGPPPPGYVPLAEMKALQESMQSMQEEVRWLKQDTKFRLEQQVALKECQVALRNGVNLDLNVRVDDFPGAPGETRLGKAIKKAWIEVVCWLLEHGADPNAESGLIGPWGPLHSDLVPPLHIAIGCISPYGIPYAAACAVLLLDAGARVDARDKDSYTSLFHVAVFGECAMVKLLLSRGASVHTVSAPHDDEYPWITHPNDPEAFARSYARALDIENDPASQAPLEAADLLADVRAAGGWAAYVAAPRNQLLAFRRLLPALRREPPSAPAHLERLFLDPNFPEDVFMHVFTFWRCNRDSDYVNTSDVEITMPPPDSDAL